MDHPRASFSLSRADRKQCRQADPPVAVDGIAHTGAQSNLWGLHDFLEAGYSLNDLRPVYLNIRAANRNPREIRRTIAQW